MTSLTKNLHPNVSNEQVQTKVLIEPHETLIRILIIASILYTFASILLSISLTSEFLHWTSLSQPLETLELVKSMSHYSLHHIEQQQKMLIIEGAFFHGLLKLFG